MKYNFNLILLEVCVSKLCKNLETKSQTKPVEKPKINDP